MRLALSFLAITLPAVAGEYVVLSSGFRIHADSHTVDGKVMHLETGRGAIEIPADSVAAIEQEEYTPPMPEAPKAPVATRLAQLALGFIAPGIDHARRDPGRAASGIGS